ncbi:MAG: hypothetical protein AB7F79_08070 [Steroidobacteraceae bacterium]
MKLKSNQVVLVALLLFLSSLCQATTVTCPEGDKLVGTYKTNAARGFIPNSLIISANAVSELTAHLTSYWAPKPFDNGERGTMGDFDGKLLVPHPWSCVAFLVNKAEAKTDELAPMCVLVLRFIGSKGIDVMGIGQCEYFHGPRAYPGGFYALETEKRK